MKKIGIVSMYHGSRNYGGLLQALALCQFLNTNGFDAKQIDVPPKMVDKKRKRLFKYNPLELAIKCFAKIRSSCLSFLIRICRKKIYVLVQNKKKNLDEFRLSIPHLCLTDELCKMNIYNNTVDVFICGSDQIWNPYAFREEYFLKFVDKNKLKIAYAASIAKKTLSLEETRILLDGVRDIEVISVREEMSKNILLSAGKKDVFVALDPTLLVNREYWDSHTNYKLFNKPYLFYYMLEGGFKEFLFAKRVAKKNGLEFVAIPCVSTDGLFVDLFCSFNRIVANTPFDFLSLIKGADLVITDSFHASLFSLFFKKEAFFIECRRTETLLPRIGGLIKIFHCEDHYLSRIEKNKIMACKRIQYDNYINDFERIRDESKKFLLSSISKK